MQKRHLFFDMDKTIAPARQPMLPEMRELMGTLAEHKDIIIVSGSLLELIGAHTHDLEAYYLGVNGNYATDKQNNVMWKHKDLSEEHKAEINAHIRKMVTLLDHDLNESWVPVEDRGTQVTFSPIGNQAPVDIKMKYDPDRKIREALLAQVPFNSEDIIVRIGGSTSFDYMHKDRHKGTNVERIIQEKGWNKDECVYYGDGLFPGGNDELVIGVIDTVLVTDELDTYEKLKNLQ